MLGSVMFDPTGGNSGIVPIYGSYCVQNFKNGKVVEKQSPTKEAILLWTG